MYSMLCAYTLKFVFNKPGKRAYDITCFSLILFHFRQSHYFPKTSTLDLILFLLRPPLMRIRVELANITANSDCQTGGRQKGEEASFSQED